jgi:hypothetical protein
MRKLLAVMILLVPAGCARESAGPIELAVSQAANAHVTLASDGDRVAAAWAATGPRGTDIYVARSDNGGRTFGSPARVNDLDGDASVNGEAPPRVLLSGNRVDVVWVSKRGGVAAIRAAESSDGGKSFSPARTITSEGVAGARGWQTAAIAADGTVHAAWLDGRNAVHAQPASTAGGQSHAHHGDMRQDIYHAAWRGTEAPIETQVAANVCFCCKTALVSHGNDLYVAWRHLFPGGVRDIAIARSKDGGRTFSDPVRVSADNWQIDACPDDGPSMAVDGSGALHVAWPTLVTDSGAKHIGIFDATSRDGGATFSPRTRVSSPESPAAHPRITLDAQGRAVIAWDEVADGARRVRVRIADAAPQTMSTGNASSYPALAPTRDAVALAWTDQAEGRSVIRVSRIR